MGVISGAGTSTGTTESPRPALERPNHLHLLFCIPSSHANTNAAMVVAEFEKQLGGHVYPTVSKKWTFPVTRF